MAKRRRGRDPYYRYTPKRKAALRKAQLRSAQKRRGHGKTLAIAAGAGVLAVGATAGVMYGRQILRGGPKNVIHKTPPQAVVHKGTNDYRIGDDEWPKVGDVIEVSMPRAKPLGGGQSRLYGLFMGGRKKTRHSSMYRVTVRGQSGGMMRNEWVPEHQITGVKIKGGANFHKSVNELMDERFGTRRRRG